MTSDAEGDVATFVPRLMQMVWGFMVSQALHVAAKLAVFDVLHDGPKTVRQVAERTGSHEPSLHRLLRMLTAVDMQPRTKAVGFPPTSLIQRR